LHLFGGYLEEYLTTLRTNGLLVVGLIPSKGGLAWGLGRFLTSRRRVLANTDINPVQLICWCIPIPQISFLIPLTKKQQLSCWPFMIPSLDINLITKFI